MAYTRDGISCAIQLSPIREERYNNDANWLHRARMVSNREVVYQTFALLIRHVLQVVLLHSPVLFR